MHTSYQVVRVPLLCRQCLGVQRPCCCAFLAFPHYVFGFVMLLASHWFSPCSPVCINSVVSWRLANCGPCDALGAHVCLSAGRDPATHPDDVRGTGAGLTETSGTPAFGRPHCRGGAPAVAIAQTAHRWCARVPAVVFLSIVARPFPWCGIANVLQLPLSSTMVQARCRRSF